MADIVGALQNDYSMILARISEAIESKDETLVTTLKARAVKVENRLHTAEQATLR